MTREEQDALVNAIDQEQRDREALTTVKPTLGKLLKDRQILLFCALYFCIQLTIYAATFWLPSIIKKMGDLTDVQVGFFNSIPWLISIIAMYAFASLSGKFKFQQAWACSCLPRAGRSLPSWRSASRPSVSSRRRRCSGRYPRVTWMCALPPR
jgi:fucose permease